MYRFCFTESSLATLSLSGYIYTSQVAKCLRAIYGREPLGMTVYTAFAARSRHTLLGLRILGFYLINGGNSKVVCEDGYYSASPYACEVVHPQPSF